MGDVDGAVACSCAARGLTCPSVKGGAASSCCCAACEALESKIAETTSAGRGGRGQKEGAGVDPATAEELVAVAEVVDPEDTDGAPPTPL